MLWIDRVCDEIEARFANKIERGETLVIRDEKTASGRVHVGSMRGVAIHGLIVEVLRERGIAARFLYEINDIDPMDDIPSYLDQDFYQPYFLKPLYQIPAPDHQADNYAEYFAKEFIEVIEGAGFHPEFYRATELYQSGRLNDAIKTALVRRDDIRRIYREVSGSQKGEDWFPLSLVVAVCQRGMPRITGWDGSEVQYACEDGQTGSTSPFDGNAKFPWKVDWAAKFMALSVDVEGGGKDHSTRGGARDVANHIAREVFGVEPPYDVPYEFFLIDGQKMSSSKGRGASAKDMADLMPAHIFRMALFRDPTKQINVSPGGDTLPIIFDYYDKIAHKYWSGEHDDEARLFQLVHPPEQRDALLRQRFLPRFSQIVFLVQMPHLQLEQEATRMKGGELTDADREELQLRAAYARAWLAQYAPEAYKYELQYDTVPEPVRLFTDKQKEALADVLDYLEGNDHVDGQELHTTLHDIRTKHDLEPRAFFGALYLSFLGKESGPKAGWFLSVLPREFLINRLQEASGQEIRK